MVKFIFVRVNQKFNSVTRKSFKSFKILNTMFSYYHMDLETSRRFNFVTVVVKLQETFFDCLIVEK